ncbi:transcriptional regulator [Companilactobacillus crustorum]|uniref:HTH cro/C1-type domain-containing protein n=3 Tax=Companilactobacillus TaxID=2767879 RepID=A0A837RKA7_9LACO|nr:helix-turn-helix transcriptional regulator [Companilactobacillus crustorum]KRK42843.1 hypothetical protein FD26_GL000323 [Companilactobacillus crustorum JCM 15951]KRO20533.1 hypothetical protein IV63_GL000455 [Companilactobacillus crustorum]GEO76772.1 transcriptional regulator [Companilactobacillus crustorum]
MDVNIFIERRKALKISQVKLCEGICTQSTLSKFENNGRIPSLSILNKLCGRLGLSVDDLYKNTTASTTHMRTVLDRIESKLMMKDYPTVKENLNEINSNEINNDELKMQFYYQKGLVNVLTDEKITDSYYYFSQILDDLDDKHQTIYTYLSYAGLGTAYLKNNQKEKAQFYFEKILDYINYHKEETFQKKNVNIYLRILTIVYYTAEFYIEDHNYEISSELVNRGIKLCSEQHITYYLPRLKLSAAKVAIGQNKSNKVVINLLTECAAFARINHNKAIELEAKALIKEYQDQVNKEH